MIKAILFDLDGTLLPMDQDVFISSYFKRLGKKMMPYGYDPDMLLKTVWKGTVVMGQNDGTKTNEEAFWNFFTSVYGEKAIADKAIFEDFYMHDFQDVQGDCGYNKAADEVVKLVKSLGFKAVLSTNPLFPSIATESRIRWAGLDVNDFELFTTYENSTYSKPNLKYYQEVLDKLGLSPEECVMVGNDVDEDMVAGKLGMKVFLLTDCMINKSNTDISDLPQGGFEELKSYIQTIR